MSWTPERVETLKKLWAEGLSASQIMRQLGGGVSRSGVIGKVHRLGLSYRATPASPDYVFRTKRPKPPPRPTPSPKVDLRQFGPGPPRALTSGQPMPPLREVAPEVPARHWLTRKFGECKWPASGQGADTRSCCAPCGEATYCAAHARIAFRPKDQRTKTGNDLVRSLRRYTG